MKLNGVSNIITDRDITLTGEQTIGKSLSAVLEERGEKLNTLEENIKFLYEHGGVGGGTGSGGGSSTKWKLKATLGNIECVSGSTIGLSGGINSYILRIWTSGGSGSYSVTYSYGNKVPTIITLNAGNAWSASIKVDLTTNGALSISATDGSITRQISGVSYIVEPYKFNAPVLVSHTGSTYPKDIFVEDAQTTGVILKSLKYAYAVNGVYTYEWYYDDVLINSGTIIDSSGDISYDISSFMTNENAATHFYKLKIYAQTESDLEPNIIEYTGSFNLIPTTLFLKLSPPEGTIFYNDDTTIDPYTFGINKIISLQARIYKGKNATNESGNLSWSIYENGQFVTTESLNVRDGRTYTLNISFSSTGWNYVVFNYNLVGESGQAITKYFYCDSISTNYNWYIDGHLPNQRRYYIAQEITSGSLNKLSGISWQGLNSANPPLYIERLSSDTQPLELTIDSFSTGEQMINIGIQYNDINNSKTELIKLYDTVNKSKDTIKIYQDKIVFGDDLFDSENECEIFLHKEQNYDLNVRSKYHLLTICMAHTGALDLNNNPYYEVTVYFDGVLEGIVSTKPITTRPIYKVDLMPGNYAINQFEIASWTLNTYTRLLNDIDINWYWNSYKSRTDRDYTITTEDSLILSSLFDSNNNNVPTYNLENQLIRVPNGFAETVANNVSVPVLVLTCPKTIAWGEGQENSIFEWINTKYTDGQGGLLKVQVTAELQYSPGKKPLSKIIIPESLGNNNTFSIQIQGSSTVNNKAKNFTLRLNSGSDIIQAGEAILFSPNYDKEDTDTFLPEQAFTLKADVVDSSHTNNTAMGKFVNENNNWNYGGNITGEEEIINHVKQCLEGFATLVFLNVSYRDDYNQDHSDYYYLGIYNFNLGRDSYFNLGYCDLSQLSVETLEDQSSGYFKFCKVGGSLGSGVDPVSGFIAAEIQDNSPYWDFSQYNNSILFPINSTETGNFMFGDIVNSSNEQNIVRNRIQNFVKSISAAGGYVFESIGKDFSDCAAQNGDVGRYNVPNTVSDYKIQHSRVYNAMGLDFPVVAPDFSSVTEGSLRDCIVDNPDENTYSKLNYDSAVYYYTTCMVFGLIDSVQKNLNIKTWTATDPERCQMGLYFYDMDTCLGKDNAGGKVSYFAFSDFWKSNIERYDANGDLIPDNDTITEVDRIVNKGCDVYRDCFLKNSGVTGYDIPSSYLFAIPKYAKAILSNFDTMVFPQQIYALWRQPGGVLENADKFINTYYTSNFDGIPECLINLNYRNKYLYDYDRSINDSGQAVSSLEKADAFHGRGIEYTRDWLSGRLHILDAYFNLGGSSIEIIGGLPEPIHNVSVQNNPDIYILSDIFTNTVNGNVQRNESFSFVVSADDYSPLFVKLGNGYRWYLFEDSSTKYETYIDITGTQVTTFGGSQLWRTLDDINGFVSTMNHPEGSFILNSNTIDSIVGTVGTHTGPWEINAPSVKNITLTSANYSGALNISNQFPSLSTIDISNSSISLIINEDQLTTGGITSINASNLKNATQLSIENCNKLTSCNLYQSKIGTCVIRPAWTDVLDFSEIYAKTLRLSTRNSGTLTINENDTVSDLQFSNMETVTIDQCPSLTTVKCIDSTSLTPLRSLTINNCTQLTTLEIVADERLEVINLYNCSTLSQIKITSPGTSFPNLRILNFGNTNISKITYVLNGNTITQTSGIFDFSTIFPNLATVDNEYNYVRFTGNTSVKSIQFNNSDVNTPTILRYSFNGCSALQRVYGTLKVKSGSSTYLFNDCGNFSVHGSTLSSVTWSGQSVLASDGRIKHPTELNENADIYCQSGPGCTNIIFDSDVTSLGESYTTHAAFRNSKCTIFDMYYILYRVTPNITNLNACFYSITASTNTRFNWTSSVDNSPHRLMFSKCTNVKYASYFCSGSTSTTYTIRLLSPTTDNNGNVIANDGLLSPLSKLTSFNALFYNYHFIVDRFLFRRTSGNYAATTIYRFAISRVVDDVNSISSYTNVSSFTNYANYIINNGGTVKEKGGNLTEFFTNLSNLSSIYGLLNVAYINFETLTIPDKITKIIQCFRSTYGTGEINLSNIFSNKTRLTTLGHSFKVSDVYDNDVPFINLSNNTFERFIPRPATSSESAYNGLVYIANTDGTVGNASYLLTDKTDNCFGGVIRKYVTDPFPYDIFANLPNLQQAEGVFQNAEGNISNLVLPGNLFENNTKLTSCRACFFNIKIPYKISPTHEISYEKVTVDDEETAVLNITESSSTYWNFINCPKIDNVAYLFGGSTYVWLTDGTEKNADDMPSLVGFIPKNLFWHGVKLSIKKLVGANERTQNLDNSYTYEQLHDSIILVEPTATISDISYCFCRSNLDPYENTDPYVEDNPNYSPYVWNYDSSRDRYVENTSRNTDKQTIIWYYDGVYSHKPNDMSNIEQLDKVNDVVLNPSETMEENVPRYRIRASEWQYDMDVLPTATWNYIAPPDLLRYCIPKANITYLFYRCGIRGTNSYYSAGESRNKYVFGLKGRICPYMLKPVADTNSIAYMFHSCKCLSYISDDLRERDYWIPEDFFYYAKNVTDLTAAFAYTVQPNRSVLEFVFDKLGDPLNVVNSNALTINSIFYFVHWINSSSNRALLQNIFIHNRITSLTSCFRVRSDVSSSNEVSPSYQYVTFRNIFPTSGVRYNSSSYDNKTGFKTAFYGFHRDTVIFEGTKTLCNSTNNNNYRTTTYNTPE